ncbi:MULTISPECIES: VacJ family lipoprotein [unclassified Novosphingobium]|uniref:MlaA family lipoprotein n=1 Tax=unclassified Novosphingobium TaxID=2644732 RepID=UPI00135BB3DA|nr:MULTISPECIES: VacJ family lipoprotein [unclassified Novosphingobium]
MSLTATAAVLIMSSAAPVAEPLIMIDPVVAVQAEPQPDAAPEPTAAPLPAPSPDVPSAAPGNDADAIQRDVTQGDDIVVMRRQPAPPGDPLERINEQSFKTVQAVDNAVLKPVAQAYNKGLPGPVRQGLRNFFSNLGEPVVFAAYLLEFKPGKALETAGRFAINTTIGAAGLVDMAKRKPFNLPYRPNGLANVMGYYGVGPGPYMYLPIIGPTTLRDIIGDSVDKMLVPAVVGKPFTKPAVVIPATILGQLGERAAFDSEVTRIREEDNPYATYRELYLKQRKAEINALHGRMTPAVVPVYGRAMPTAGTQEEDGTTQPEQVPQQNGSTPPPHPDPAANAQTGEGGAN